MGIETLMPDNLSLISGTHNEKLNSHKLSGLYPCTMVHTNTNVILENGISWRWVIGESWFLFSLEVCPSSS